MIAFPVNGILILFFDLFIDLNGEPRNSEVLELFNCYGQVFKIKGITLGRITAELFYREDGFFSGAAFPALFRRNRGR